MDEPTNFNETVSRHLKQWQPTVTPLCIVLFYTLILSNRIIINN